MKAKTIKAVLRKKIDEWLGSIEDDNVRSMASKGVIVTGGAIASMLLREPVNDFDIYFRDYETTRMVADYYLKRFQPQTKAGIACEIYLADEWNKPIGGPSTTVTYEPMAQAEKREKRIKIVIRSAGIASADGTDKPYEYFESRPVGEASGYVSDIMTDPGDIQDTYEQTEKLAQEVADDKPKYRPIFLSTNAITLSDKVQVIVRFFGEPDAIHENYDFIHCTNYWTSWNSELVLRQAALEALLTKELRYVGSKYPVCSLIRLRKFIQRDWTVNAGQILKMVMQVSALDMQDYRVLEEQLTGVDCAYFAEILAKVKENDPEKLNAAYLVEIIDRML